MGISSDCLHNVISEIGSETAEDWIIGEENGLDFSIIISDLDAEQEGLKMLIHALVLLHSSLHFFLKDSFSLLRVVRYINNFI